MTSEREGSPGSKGAGPSRSVVVLGPLSRRINRFVVKVAGRGRVGPLARVRHRGRRSGRQYTAPVIARADADGFVIPLFFGPDADWCRNVLAAQGCEIDWHSATHSVNRPRMVPAESVRARVRSGFPPHERLFFKAAGIGQYMLLDRADGASPR